MKAFVDTSAFFALWWKDDQFHNRAKEVLAKTEFANLLTSNFIIGETLILLSKKVSRMLAHDFGNRVFEEKVIDIFTVDPAIEKAAWDIFRESEDRDLSFTDCTSFVIMKENGLKSAFSFDEHFQEFGFKLIS